jgi:GntR family transcriptional repressor for pyruvate dehydrogenase complex
MDLGALAPVTRRTLSEEVLDRLLELIAAGASPTQRLLPEHALCERLGVSRSALREALSGLGHRGVIETRGKARIGSTVAARSHLLRRAALAGSTIEEVRHALEARRLLEPPMAALAAERATPETLDRVRQFLDLMEDGSEEGDMLVDHDSGFHVSIARATGNPTLVHMVSAIADALSSTRALSLHAPRGVERSMAGHREIMAALSARDADGARRAMEEHLDEVAALIALSAGAADDPAPPP